MPFYWISDPLYYNLWFGQQKSKSLLNSMFHVLNSMLYNSEEWHSIVKDDTETLNRVDESLLSGLVSAHAKTPKDALFLETGTTPIRFIWASR